MTPDTATAGRQLPEAAWATATPPTHRLHPDVSYSCVVHSEQYTHITGEVEWFTQSDDTVVIITDGSSQENGTRGSFAALTVTGPHPRATMGVARGICSPLRSELLGILAALWLCPLDKQAIFVLDCESALRLAPHLPDLLIRRPNSPQDRPGDINCPRLKAMLRAFVPELDPNADVLKAIHIRYAMRTQPLAWHWFPGHTNEDDINNRTPLGAGQALVDALCDAAAAQLEKHNFPADHSLLHHQPRFTLRRRDGALVTTKPKPFIYKAASTNTPAKSPSNSVTTSWRMPHTSAYHQKILTGAIDRDALKFFINCRSNHLFTDRHWRDFTNNNMEGPMLPCPACPDEQDDTLAHIFATCPGAIRLAAASDRTLATKLANRGSVDWSNISDLHSKVTAFCAAQPTMTLQHTTVSTPPNKQVTARGEYSAAYIGEFGLPVKSINIAGGWFEEQDKAASAMSKQRKQPPPKSRAKNREAPAHDTIQTIRVPPAKPPPPPHIRAHPTSSSHALASLPRHRTPHPHQTTLFRGRA